MTGKHKFTLPERIAARIAGKMILHVRRNVLREGISHLYWRGFQAGVRASISSIVEGHKTVRRLEKLSRCGLSGAFIERLASSKVEP